MRLSILLYDGFTTLDAVGGYEVLSRIPGMETEFVAVQRGVIASDTRVLGLLAYKSFDEVTATDILYVPGGPGGFLMEKNAVFLDKVRALDRASTWTFGVCNGVGILGAAGLLNGKTAATNWFYQERLAAHGATFTPDRYHRDGKYVTSAGVSASIDAGLYLASLIAGEFVAKALQLGIEYYPAPPFPEKAPLDAPKEVYELIENFEATGGADQMQRKPVFDS